ncbi:TPA: hypothetical protein I8220_001681 [Aeromonas hydrophila]|jgi:hypothetical protein|uniref:hypothetical protein n=1 Tax=Aeromonas hydrophila TaxID=644 RepID=UPI000466D8D6|nr:hypothetical protein [Aeromonas hydrophila]MBW3831385.1 hypothetical protein [Aeromonas hydrophila]MBW5265665.1 hypothetical protein [Aeromonas hydrophila]MBW5276152.1 hypothetical protein [Aeromonas hydrophila]BDC83729.1 hypothetical protein NUITMVA1_36720 [Aeromonas hydrophila]HAT2490106.1 hypothetical protein [Aeromonas hydrophila]
MSPRIWLLGSILLSGCALLPAPATVSELPSVNPAQQRFQIECGAPEECQQQALLSCPHGYQQVDRSKRTVTTHQMSMGVADPVTGFRPGFPQTSTFTTHMLLVQCPRTPAQPHPLGR